MVSAFRFVEKMRVNRVGNCSGKCTVSGGDARVSLICKEETAAVQVRISTQDMI